MAMQAHLVELERKHKILENELHEALVHLSTDDLQIVELKRRKLMVKDEIERLKHTAERNTALAKHCFRATHHRRLASGGAQCQLHCLDGDDHLQCDDHCEPAGYLVACAATAYAPASSPT